MYRPSLTKMSAVPHMWGVSERKAPLSTRAIRHMSARAGELAGIAFPVHPHQLRHDCGYYLALTPSRLFS
jgi:site-specific recombinase XerD